MNKLISIIVPIYKVENYLKRCIDSILNQTYTNLEIILVDDGSPDNCGIICDEYAKQDCRVKVIHKKNGGLSDARNCGIKVSTGEYLIFVDSDDYILKNMCETLLKNALENNADIVSCNFKEVYLNGQEKINKQSQNQQISIVSNAEAIYRYFVKNDLDMNVVWNKIYKKSLLENIKYPSGNFVGEDYAIQVQVLPKAKKVCVVPGAGHHYVQVADSMCRGGYNENYITAFRNYECARRKYCEKYPQFSRDICNYLVTEYMAIIVAMGKNKMYNQDMIIQIQKFVKKHLFSFLKTKEVPVIMKGSAVVVSVNYRLLNLVYNLVGKMR